MRSMTRIAMGFVLALTPVPAMAQQPADAGLSVSLPMKELRAILDKDRAADAAPVDVVFGPAVYTVVAGDKSAELTVTADLTLPNPRWVMIPLGTGVGTTTVLLDDQPAAVVRKDGRLSAVFDARNKRAAKLKLIAQLPIRVQGDVSSLALPLIPAPIATWSARLPAANLVVKSPEIVGLKSESAGNVTTATGAMPQADSVAVQWSPRDARPARVTVQQLNLAVVDRGVLRYAATLQYDIARAPVEKLQVRLPDGVDLTRVTGEQLADYALDEAAKPRLLTLQLKEPTQGATRFVIQYEVRLKDDQLKADLALVSPVDVSSESGFVGIEVRGNYEVTPTAEKADRMDVAQLPDALSTDARSPVRYGYRYDKAGATFAVALRPLQDLEVLIAMSDITEVSTTVTPEGQVITKMIMIVRNNQKSHLRVTLPEKAQLWSAFVDDRPVTPSKDDKGDVLVPLRKSKAIDEDDDQNYVNKRNQRRKTDVQKSQGMQKLAQAARRLGDVEEVSDLKPYDVELVYISPAIAMADRGQIKLALPKVDVPIGKLAWAVFLPTSTKVVDAAGTIREVDTFSLPFRHFGEAGLAETKQVEKAQAVQQALDQMKALEELSVSAKAKGVLPVRIEIPIVGAIHRFEKTLSVNEALSVDLSYVKRN